MDVLTKYTGSLGISDAKQLVTPVVSLFRKEPTNKTNADVLKRAEALANAKIQQPKILNKQVNAIKVNDPIIQQPSNNVTVTSTVVVAPSDTTPVKKTRVQELEDLVAEYKQANYILEKSLIDTMTTLSTLISHIAPLQ